MKMTKGPEQVRRTKGRATRRSASGRTSRTASPGSSANHPEISDGAISNLIGTTRTTIAAIRDRSHWNIANITPKDPVTLGLTTQRELDSAVAKAAKATGGNAEAQPTDTRLEATAKPCSPRCAPSANRQPRRRLRSAIMAT